MDIIIADGSAGEVVREILKRENRRQAELASMMGVTPQRISSALDIRKGDMSFRNFQKMCRVLGYDIVVKRNADANKLEVKI